MATISKGTVVQIDSSSGDKPAVIQWAPSSYEEPSITSGLKILGVAMTDSEEGEPVAVMRRGYLRDMSDGAETWSAGDVIYATSSGALTKTRPTAPFPQVIVGTVFQANGSNWDLEIDVRVLPNVGELTGVQKETPVNLDVLIYNGTTHCWVPRQIDHGGDIAGLLDDDHTQYLKEKASGGLASEIPLHNHSGATEAGQVDHGNANTAASLADDDHPQYKKKHGFSRDSAGAHLVTMSYNKTTRVVTITPTGSTFDIWVGGVKYTKTGAQASAAHTATTGKWYLTYDSSGNLGWSSTAWSVTDETKIPVALVYYYSGLSDGICFFEAHEAKRNLALHKNLHFTQGTKLISGGSISGYTLATDTDAAVTYAIASAVIADEDIFHTLTALADGGPYMIFERTGAAGDWTWTESSTFPFRYGTTYPSYNDPNGGGAGVWGMTEMTGTGTGYYMNYFVTAIPAVTAARQFALIPGQQQYTTQAAAELGSLAGLALGTLPAEEIAPLYRVTLKALFTHGGTHKVQIVSVTSILAGGASLVSSATPSVHNALSGRDTAGAHPASAVTFTPYTGATLDIAATNVQDAIEEIADEVGTAGSLALDDLTDVNAPTPSPGDVLAWNDGAGEWQPTTASAPGAHESTHEAGQSDELPLENMGTAETTVAKSLHPDGGGGVAWALTQVEDLTTVDTTTTKVLKPDGLGGVQWVAGGAVSDLADLGDVDLTGLNDGDLLVWDNGAGNWVPYTPSSGVADSGQPDEVPSSPTAYDDEFTSSSLDGKWTASGTATLISYGGTAPAKSWLRAKFTGSQNYSLAEAYSSAAGTAFSATAKYSMQYYGNYNSCGMYAYESGDNNAFGMTMEWVGTGQVRGAHHRRDSGTWSFSFATGTTFGDPGGTFYVHLQRDSSNNWQAFISADGIGWIPCAAAYSKSFSVAKLTFGLNSNATAPTGGFIMGGIDWIRVNWLTL